MEGICWDNLFGVMETSPISWFWRMAWRPVKYLYGACVCIYNTFTDSIYDLSSTSQKGSSELKLPLHLLISCDIFCFFAPGLISFLSVYNNHPTAKDIWTSTPSPPRLMLLSKWMAMSLLSILRIYKIKFKGLVCQFRSVGTWPVIQRPSPILPSQRSSFSSAFIKPIVIEHLLYVPDVVLVSFPDTGSLNIQGADSADIAYPISHTPSFLTNRIWILLERKWTQVNTCFPTFPCC